MDVRKSFPARYLAATLAAIASDRVLYLALALYCVLGLVYLLLIGQFDLDAFNAMNAIYFGTSLVGYAFTFPLLLLTAGIAHVTLRLSSRRMLAYRGMFGPANMARVLAGTVLMFAMVPFRAVFNVLKVSIADTGPFLYDRALADFDRALHFGVDPFRLLFAFAKNDFVLRAVELYYNNLWFVVVFGALYWVAVAPRAATIRVRFVLCFVLSWAITGGLFAILGSSAGPVYFGHVTGDVSRFADLVSFVDSTRGQFGSASQYQHYLWDLQAGHVLGLGSGISAFPSMHVAMITVMALFVTEASRKWAMLAWGLVALTCFSSVYLGWHYAIDGYVAIALTTASHFAVRAIMLNRWRWRRAAEPEAAAETAA